jgi:putative PIN family toxin of toxin-antitoxin system
MIKTVIDTNVVISAIFWGGLPRKLLKLVHDGVIQQYATPEIIDEYEEICLRIGSRLKVDYRPSLDLILRNLFLVSPVGERERSIFRKDKSVH